MSFKNFCGKRLKRGFSLVESLILIVIVSLTIGAILQTSAVTTALQISGRGHIDSFVAASSWFAALESVKVENQTDFNNAIATINKTIGDKSAYVTDHKFTDKGNGILEIEITVLENDKSHRKMVKYLNKYSYSTVSDDRERR